MTEIPTADVIVEEEIEDNAEIVDKRNRIS